MSERPLSYRSLAERLRRFDAAERTDRGRGSHRIWQRRVESGRVLTSPVPFHGAGRDIPPGTIRSIRKLLGLSPRDGVSDRAFYGD